MSRIILAQAEIEAHPEPVAPGEVLDLGVNPVTGATPGAVPGAGPEAHDAVHAAAGAAHGPFPAFDATMFASHLFWFAVSFGMLYFVVQRFVVPRVGGIVEDRNTRIVNDVGEASRLSRETDEMIAEYEAELASARQRAYTIATARRDDLKAEQAKRQAETEAALNQRIAQSEREIARRRDAALADVDAIAAEATQAIVARVAGIDASAEEAREAVVRTEVARVSD